MTKPQQIRTDTHHEAGENPIRLESLTHNACCCRVSIGSQLYAICDLGIGFVTFMYWLRWLAYEQYPFITEDELSDSVDNKRKHLIAQVITSCGGEAYIRETKSDSKYIQFVTSCVLSIFSSIGFFVGGVALLHSTMMRNFSKKRSKLVWVFLYVQIPSVVIGLISAILITDKTLCEIDYYKEKFQSVVLILTVLLAIIYKPHEILVSVLYLRDLENKVLIVKAILARRKLRKQMLEKQKQESEAEENELTEAASRCSSIASCFRNSRSNSKANFRARAVSSPTISIPSIHSSHSAITYLNEQSANTFGRKNISPSLTPSKAQLSMPKSLFKGSSANISPGPSINKIIPEILLHPPKQNTENISIDEDEDINNLLDTTTRDRNKAISWMNVE